MSGVLKEAMSFSFLVMRKRPSADMPVWIAARSIAAVSPDLMSCSACGASATLDAVDLTKLCHRGSRQLLVDRREVVIASEVVEDGREILAGVSFPHREAIQLFRSIA